MVPARTAPAQSRRHSHREGKTNETLALQPATGQVPLRVLLLFNEDLVVALRLSPVLN
jgi:hypothetical protein